MTSVFLPGILGVGVKVNIKFFGVLFLFLVLFFFFKKRLGCNLIVEHLPRICKALGSVYSMALTLPNVVL